MKRNSVEIEELLFNKQIDLYIRIDNLINKQFDELEADVMSVLTRTLMDLEDRIQLYKKDLEMYVVKESGRFSCRGFRCLNV